MKISRNKSTATISIYKRLMDLVEFPFRIETFTLIENIQSRSLSPRVAAIR
jgi:hypothetical protein